MKLTIASLPAGSQTDDSSLLEQLQGLSFKLDEECESLLPEVPARNDGADALADASVKPFGVVYARDLDAGSAVGYLKYVPDGSICRIEGLYVDREYRRKCIGYSLMKAFYGICRKEGFAKISLGCIASNEAAMAFYASEGYRVSSASYILCRKDEKSAKKRLPISERKFTEDDFCRLWSKACSLAGISDDESGLLYQHYVSGFDPVAICSADGFECAVLAHRTDSELYVPVIDADPKAMNQEFLDSLADALVQYAESKGFYQICVTDVHLPADLDGTSSCWKRAGCTLCKLADDLRPKKPALRA